MCESKAQKFPPAYPMRLGDEEDVVKWIAEITSGDEESIRARLRREFEQPGANVAEAFAGTGLESYVWSDDLGRFYERTDAFIYELVLWNRNSIKRRMRRWIARYLAEHEGPELKILCVGDGLGFDSFYLARRDHKVTYYEVAGYTHYFAGRLFRLANADIEIVTDDAQMNSELFDVVICLDVLEHVPDVPGFVAQLTNRLRSGGFFFVHAPFYMVHPTNPTHLKTNRKYSGSLRPFSKCGLRLIGGEFFWNPLVFEKISDDIEPHSRSLARIFILRLVGLYLALGRFSNLPFRWVEAFRLRRNRWFD
ncbi:MAG: methyltransferase domain-containing protein [Sedimentisphaerales bacterium]|nr:methyltransferase domain-containing protein [Sedimentisphaerales bacterium]